jgi:hypothetical protein
MNLMALLAQAGIVRSWADYAPALKRMADWFQRFGTDAGAMHVSVAGELAGRSVTRHWDLVATHGDGPYVPTLAAAALVRRLATGIPVEPGALPCLGLLALSDFELEAAALKITMRSHA